MCDYAIDIHTFVCYYMHRKTRYILKFEKIYRVYLLTNIYFINEHNNTARQNAEICQYTIAYTSVY